MTKYTTSVLDCRCACMGHRHRELAHKAHVCNRLGQFCNFGLQTLHTCSFTFFPRHGFLPEQSPVFCLSSERTVWIHSQIRAAKEWNPSVLDLFWDSTNSSFWIKVAALSPPVAGTSFGWRENSAHGTIHDSRWLSMIIGRGIPI